MDFAGYDVELRYGAVTRQVQLKSSLAGGRVAFRNISKKLEDAPSGCIVWSVVGVPVVGDPPALPVSYRVLGAGPGAPFRLAVGLATAKQARGNVKGEKADRPGFRRVPKARFSTLEGVSVLSDWLFGPP